MTAVIKKNVPGLPDPTIRGYSHIAIGPLGGRPIHVSGQAGENEKGELSADFREQCQQTLRNMQLMLGAAGAGMADVAKLTVLMVGISWERMGIFNETLLKACAGSPLPACTLIPVYRLATEEMLIEVDAVAYLAT